MPQPPRIPPTIPPSIAPGLRRTTRASLLGLNNGAVSIREGAADATMGIATLVAGSVVVLTTAVRADSRILLTTQTAGGTPGALRVAARTPGTSFQINSSSGADTSVVAWQLIAPTNNG